MLHPFFHLCQPGPDNGSYDPTNQDKEQEKQHKQEHGRQEQETQDKKTPTLKTTQQRKILKSVEMFEKNIQDKEKLKKSGPRFGTKPRKSNQ